MAHHHVCPWWLGYFLITPLRKLVQSPRAILGPFVRGGLTVVELGPGMGFFTLELARLVGPSGRVVAVDLQAKMLRTLMKRAKRVHVAERIEPHESQSESMGIAAWAGRVDFMLAFAVVHELPASAPFFAEAHQALRSGAKLLVAEPRGHVSDVDFSQLLETAQQSGFAVESCPTIWRSHTVLLVRH